MGSPTLLQLGMPCASPSSLAPQASLRSGDSRWAGNSTAGGRCFNPLSNSFAANQSSRFRLPNGNAPRPQWQQFRVADLFGRKPAVVVEKNVIPDPDYRIPIVLLGTAGALVYTDNLIPAVPVGLLGLLLLVQTTRVKFVFENDALEVKIGEDLKDSGENTFVGGENRWKYSSFVNWEFWWPNFPVLVYFKETQTKPEGQIHFFPIIFNGKQVYDVMIEKCGPSQNSGPK